MNITAYHAGSGDCVLVTSTDGKHHILVDGGRSGPYEDHIRAQLGNLRAAGGTIDLLCVSHIDNDHVSGVLKLLSDEVAWRKHEFELDSDPNAEPPPVPRPPAIGQVWHNALFVLVGESNDHLVAEIASAISGLMGGSDEDHDLAHELENIATGFKEGMEISRRISDHHLGLNLNPSAEGGLLKRTTPGSLLELGNMKHFVLGPSDDDLERLRRKWDTWLRTAGDRLESLHDRLRDDEAELVTFDPGAISAPAIGLTLGEGNITPPNLASIMMLIEEGDETLLLTGDGSSEEILQGLEHHGKIGAAGEPGDRLHVTTLKVQHHGASANVTEDFVKRVTADNYLFCSNGSHHNPEIEVLKSLAKARLTGIGSAEPVGLDSEFKFWFTSSENTPGIQGTSVAKPHMDDVRTTVNQLVAASGGRMTAQFIDDGQLEIGA